VIRLSLDLAPEPLPYRRLYDPATVTAQEVNLNSLSLFFRYSLALSAWKQSGQSRWALRVNPSSGNLHPTEGYLLHESVGDQGKPTLYHYTADWHALERRAVFDTQAWTAIVGRLPAGSFLFGLTSILWRESWKYGERGFRYCQHDLGHALAAARLSAAMLGWQLRPLTDWSTADIAALLGTDRREDFPTEEQEEAELLAVVAPSDQDLSAADLCPPPSDVTLAAVRASHWFGKANRLSTDYVRWPLIDAAAAASRKPRGTLIDESPEKRHERPTLPLAASDVEAHRIVLQRRSALDMDGRSHTTLEIFLSMLARVIPGNHAPWDVIDWSPKIHLAIFVHRVEGMVPGLYCLVRDQAKQPILQSAMRTSFLWQAPPGVPADLPLYLLAQADCRDAARQLSCHQDIAAHGFFSLAMLAEFEEPIRRNGAWMYRALFWEAGLIGQVLYLEAEAWGARATGIGCYFDDPVHEVLGLQNRQFQDLYHFAVGIPVDDPRLQSWPPYEQHEHAAR
jgi:SagB-type dehydrogenase family enzyme